jgi:hypothetical protein
MIAMRHKPVQFPLVATFVMSGVMSLLLTATNLGMPSGFFELWLASWALAWLAASPVAMLANPLRGVSSAG